MKNLNRHSMKTENDQTQELRGKKMKAKKLILGLVALSILSFAASVSAEVPQLINYQGVLTDSMGCPLDGEYDMVFRMYNAESGGDSLWGETHGSVSVTQGNFNVLLGSGNPIPHSLFLNDSLWLEVEVEGEVMEPRQRIASVGYAFSSHFADTADHCWTTSDRDWTFRITDTADTTLITGGAWGIARYGNILYGNADSTHVNLGVACTTGTSGQNYKHSTVSGGYGNKASDNYVTVGGGYNNIAGGHASTIGGGAGNRVDSLGSTIGGGWGNTSDVWATVGGGLENIASGDGAAIGGGGSNIASGALATVSGGVRNFARGSYSVVSGGGGPFLADSNLASGAYSVIGGGRLNIASGNYSTVIGGRGNTADGYGSTVSGYEETVSGDYSFAAGRHVNIDSTADYTFAFGNNFTTSTPHAVVFFDDFTEMKVGIQTTSPTARLDVYGSTGYNQVRMRTSYTPTGTNDPNGNVGDIAWDDDYFYVKTTAGWKRVALSTW